MVILLAWEESPRTKCLIETSAERNQFVAKVTGEEQPGCAACQHDLCWPPACDAQCLAAVQRVVSQRVSSVKERDRRVPFDGVPDWCGQLSELFVRLHIRMSAAAVVDPDNRAIR